MRFSALEAAHDRPAAKPALSDKNIKELYASNVFNDEKMRRYLSKDAYQAIQNAIINGSPITRHIADQVASGMKRWALERGATHYTHWFQPLSGSTAEKHDSFYHPSGDSVVDKFSGDELVQQEPDASSLPSGGLRNTFEARGYTAWDPTSPAFIYENTAGKTLCIPTVFVSYNGEALDYKAPLLKSTQLLNKAATAACKLFFNDVKRVTVSLGIEQEYFLVDRALHNARPDLIMSGRTLIGYSAAKNQQMEDHYFGSIPDRVFNYMYDFEIEAMKLGIPLRTRHNEVAPGQYECAPMFEEVNLANDHNQLLMDLMDDVARRHGFKVLLHEKPFAGINGSGKHNNWSMITDTGVNLLSPGNNPDSNLAFLSFFVNTIKAVHDHDDLIRASIASASNDHRLGANEAPPAIISIFIGSTLTKVLDAIEQKIKPSSKQSNGKTINLANIPEILVDNTDRNRTSPFAFTGNKFELRAVGSHQNCASPMTVLNTAVANQLIEFKKEVDALVSSKKMKKKEAVLEILGGYIKQTRRILFEGNGYSEEWVLEAKKRGLNNIKDTPRAVKAFVSPSTIELMTRHQILSKEELHARYEILLEAFAKEIQIEGRIIDELAYTQILPAAFKYQTDVADSLNTLIEAGLPDSAVEPQRQVLKSLVEHAYAFKNAVDQMVDERRKANVMKNTEERAIAYGDKVKGLFAEIRYRGDKLERIVDDNLWEMPKYRELLYAK